MDFVSDQSHRHLLRLDSVLSVPDYVKKCPVPESSDAFSELPDRLFAKRASREFPIGEPGHVYLSYAYCKSAGIADPRLLACIKAAGEAFNILPDLEAIDVAFKAETKQAAAPEPRFAVQMDFGAAEPESANPFKRAGGIQGFYPINTPAQIEKSAADLANEKSRIPMELFVDGCETIVKVAREMGVADNYLPREILRYGEERVVNLDFVKTQCEHRAEKTGEQFYADFAKSAASGPTDVDLGQYRELLLEADRRFGVEYNDHVMDPYEIFSAGPTKVAHLAELNKWTLFSENVAVPVKALAELPENRIRMHFPKEAAEKVILLVKSAATQVGAAINQQIDQLDEPSRKTLLRLLAA